MTARNADLIMQYAIFAQEMDNPWTMFESRSIGLSSRKIIPDLELNRFRSVVVPQYSYVTPWAICRDIPAFNSGAQQFRVVSNGN